MVDLLIDGTFAVHILAGVVALLAGVGAIVTRKGGQRHNQAGKVYVGAMAIVVVTAVPLAVRVENWFLLAIAVFSGYLVFAGYRVVMRRRARLQWATLLDWVGHGTMLVVGAVMVGAGGWQIATGSPGLAPVLVVFGLIGLGLAARSVVQFRQPPDERLQWFETHVPFMGGAYIATVTAAVTVNLTMLPPLTRWLGPTLVGVPLIFYALRIYRPVFGRPRSAEVR